MGYVSKGTHFYFYQPTDYQSFSRLSAMVGYVSAMVGY
jgi:hypothetical protein